MLEYRAFNQVSEEIRTDIWNKGFSDYIRPIAMTKEQLNQRLTELSLSEDYSFIVFDNGIAKGITLYGTKEIAGVKTCWIGGLAVPPEYRKEGIALAMLTHIETLSQALGVELITLEVISTNEKALNLYLKKGYRIARQVGFIKGELKHPAKKSSLAVLKTEIQTDYSDLSIPWQNRLFQGHQQGIIKVDNQKIGSIVYQKAEQTLQLYQLDLPRDYINDLLVYFQTELGIEKVVGVNLLSNSDEVLGLINSGLKVDLEQYQLEKIVS